MESVFLFELVGNLLAPSEKERLVETLALLVDIDRDYMNMVPVNIFMLIYIMYGCSPKPSLSRYSRARISKS